MKQILHINDNNIVKQKKNKRLSGRVLAGFLVLSFAAVSLSACAIAEQVSSSEATTEEAIPMAGSIQLYHATEDGVEKDDTLYQLKPLLNLGQIYY